MSFLDFYIKNYIIFSIFYLLTFHFIGLKANPKNPFEALNELRELVEEIQVDYPKISNFIEYLINESLECNQIPAFMFLFLIFLIPFLRVALVLDIIIKYIKRS